ncbi:MAG: TIGR01777 family oxidoreductase [Acidimicrobiia bacterium]
MDIAITGSTGLIGTALVESLEARGDRVFRVVRRRPGTDEIRWDPASGQIDAAGLEGIDAVIHLAGAGIGDRRWTEDYKRTIRDSRVDGTRLLAETLAGLTRPPQVFVSQSGTGYYGDRGDEVLTEASAGGDGFLADVVSAWEAAAEPARRAGIRVVHPRTAQVLTHQGGSLARQLPLFRLGLGGRFGPGDQWWCWISLDDQVAATLHVLSSSLDGPVNFSAPDPVRNREFARALGRALRRPSLLPVPAFGPKLVVGGELAESLLFGSQRVMPERLLADGFEFTHPTIESALETMVARAA